MMVLQLLYFSVFALFISHSSGLSEFFDILPTFSPNAISYFPSETAVNAFDALCPTIPATQWDSSLDFKSKPGLPYQDYQTFNELCDFLLNAQDQDTRPRSSRSISFYYPPSLACTSPQIPPIPQILTLDSSILARPLELGSKKLPMFVQMFEVPKNVVEAAANVITPDPVIPPLAEVAKPLLGAIKSAACKAQALTSAAKTKTEVVATTMATTVVNEIRAAATTEAPPEATTNMIEPETDTPPEASEEMEAPPTPPPDVEKEAEVIDSIKPSGFKSLPQKMISGGSSDRNLRSEAERCFIETITQPHLNYLTYELQLPH